MSIMKGQRRSNDEKLGKALHQSGKHGYFSYLACRCILLIGKSQQSLVEVKGQLGSAHATNCQPCHHKDRKHVIEYT